MKAAAATPRRPRRRGGPARRRLHDDRLAVRAPAARHHAARAGAGGPARPGRRRALEDLAARISPRVLEAPAQLDQARRELDLYFEGKLRDFDLPLDWQLSEGLPPQGAAGDRPHPLRPDPQLHRDGRSAGNERAVRAAGTACGSNPIPIVVPCHRVLRTGGALGGYGGGLPMKEALLELEGVARLPDWRILQAPV